MKTKKRSALLAALLILAIFLPLVLLGLRLSRPVLAGWWPDGGTAWLNRKQLTLSNNSGGNLNANAVVTITVDTQSLYTLGKLKSDCSDLRILYHPSAATNKELTRYVGFPSGTTCATSTSSKVSFALQASLTNASNSTNYYLYYNNPDATAPTNNQTAFSVGSSTATFVCPFDGSSTCLAAGTATPSTETGSVRYSGSKSAMSFDGKSDKVDGSTIVQTSGTQFTAEFWTNIPDLTKYDSASTDVRFFDTYTYGGVSLKIYNGFGGSSNRRMYFNLNTTGGSVTVTNCDISALSSNSWHHIAAVYNGTTMYVYIDGTSCGSAAQSGTVNITSQSLSIGASYDSAYLGTIIDEFRISNTARYSANFTTSTAPFVRDSTTKLLLHFDENGDDPRQTGKTIDDSGNGYHGTITGAKYVAGLVGVDASTSNTGNIPRQSYAGHEGVFLEEATTNKITNPSFENATYNLNWTAGANLTATQNTTVPYYKFGSNSAKLVASATAISGTSNMYYININAGSTSTHALSAYVYNGTAAAVGGTVDATIAKLVYNGAAVTTTYVDQGGGWWQLIYTAAGINAAADYGVEVQVGKTVYVDGVQLEALAYATTYTDGTLGTGYSWSGTANNSTSTRAAADLRYANASNVSATAGSASFWIKTPWAGNDGVAHTIADFQTSAGTLRIQKNAANNIILYDGTNTASKAVTWAANSWNHIAVDWGSSNMHVYVNSTAGTAAGAFSAPTLSTSMFVGQNTSNADIGDAVVSDFRIYNAVLSANDVSDLYYSGLVGHSENIVIDRFGGGDTKGQDPLAVWHMDEGYGTTVNDSSRNTKPLTASGATWESGIGNTRSARARFLKFDGSTSYLSRAQDSGFDFGTGSFSASGWFRHTSTAPASGTHTILARYGSAGFKVYMNTSGYVCFGIDADSTWSPADTACSGASDGSLADSKWHHIEAVKNATTSISLYIDGHLAQTTTITATGSMNTSSILYLGVDSTGNSNYWNGWLDEFMVYPYARSAAQTKVDANASTAVLSGVEGSSLTQGLVGYWKMDESSGNAADSSGNAYTLTNNATATFAAGKFANAGSLASASSQYFNTATNMGNIQTTSFWINPTSTTTYLVDLNGTQTITAAGTIAANSFTGSTIYVNGAISSTITANVWQHVVVTSTTAYAASAFAVGKVGANYLNGAIDDVRIYNRALSPREVRDLYNWAPGPAVYLPMDEGSGTSANDSSGNSRTGTLNDGPTWSAGKYGKGIKLDGSNDDVSVGDFGY